MTHSDQTETQVQLVRSALLGDIPHGFTTRRGGVSQGAIASLNLGLGADEPRENVMENRRRAVEAILPGAQLVTLHQVHSAQIIHVTGAIDPDARPKADGMVTDRPGLLLGALGADCPPLLFADSRAGIVGAAHSGWKGTLAGIGPACVAQMEKLGADRDHIRAAIGPAIAQKSYEVDEPFLRRFVEADPAYERFFRSGQRPGHYQFDMEGFIAASLAAAGIGQIDCMGLDSYSDEARFYSYRRATHRKEPDYGRHMGAIGLPG